MTKLTKKVFAMLLTVTLMLLSVSTAATATSLFPVTGEEIISGNYNELGIRSVVSTYFDQREAFILGTSETIEDVNPGVLTDETAHRDEILTSDAEWLDSNITINSVACFESHAEAVVTEEVLFFVDGENQTETIVHTLQLGQLDDGTILVVRDGYLENTTGFRSCSYVPADVPSVDIMGSATEGGASCLIAVAQGEVGYVEGTGNVTKYGDTDGGGWCIAFIAWCANQADIPTSTIPQNYSPSGMRSHFVNNQRYYARSSGYTPQVGDIYFGSDNGTSVSHGGIVYAVDSNYIYTIDGNWSDKVVVRTIPRSDTYILGYGNPGYGTTGHYYSGYVYLNDTHHVAGCTHCETTKTELHRYVLDSVTGRQKCRGCGAYK